MVHERRGLLNGLGSRFANTWRGVSLSERPSYCVRGEENGIFALLPDISFFLQRRERMLWNSNCLRWLTESPFFPPSDRKEIRNGCMPKRNIRGHVSLGLCGFPENRCDDACIFQTDTGRVYAEMSS